MREQSLGAIVLSEAVDRHTPLKTDTCIPYSSALIGQSSELLPSMSAVGDYEISPEKKPHSDTHFKYTNGIKHLL